MRADIETFRKLLPEERAQLEIELARHREQCLKISSRLNASLLAVGLPEELLLEVFKTYLARWNQDLISASSRSIPFSPAQKDSEVIGWVGITHVCRRWRVVALHAPAIWTTLRVSNLLCVAAFISRSRGMPLSVEGILHADADLTRNTIDLWGLVFANSPRICSLKLEYKQTAKVQARYIPNLSFSEPDFPILQELFIQVRKDQIDQDPLLPPMLKKLERRCVLRKLSTYSLRQPQAEPLFSSTLTHLSLNKFGYLTSSDGERWTNLLALLTRLPKLESLELNGGLPPLLPAMNPVPGSLELPFIQTKPVQLQNLKNCFLGSMFSMLPAALLLRNLLIPPNCEWHLSVGVTEGALRGHLRHVGHLLNSRVVAHSQITPPAPHFTLMIDTPDDMEPGTVGSYMSFWATAQPVRPEPSLGIIPCQLLSHPTIYQLDLYRFDVQDMLDNIIQHMPLKPLDTLALGVGPRSIDPIAPVPSIECLQRVFAQAENVQTLFIRGCLAERLPDMLRPSPANGSVLFPKLKTLHLHEVEFLEQGPEGEPRRGAWWNMFTALLRAREEFDPAMRLSRIIVKSSESITKQEVKDLEEFADEVVWDQWLGDESMSIMDPDSEPELDSEEPSEEDSDEEAYH